MERLSPNFDRNVEFQPSKAEYLPRRRPDPVLPLSISGSSSRTRTNGGFHGKSTGREERDKEEARKDLEGKAPRKGRQEGLQVRFQDSSSGPNGASSTQGCLFRIHQNLSRQNLGATPGPYPRAIREWRLRRHRRGGGRPYNTRQHNGPGTLNDVVTSPPHCRRQSGGRAIERDSQTLPRQPFHERVARAASPGCAGVLEGPRTRPL